MVTVFCPCFWLAVMIWHNTYELQAESDAVQSLLDQFPGLTLPTACLWRATQAEIAVYAVYNRLFLSILTLCNANLFLLWRYIQPHPLSRMDAIFTGFISAQNTTIKNSTQPKVQEQPKTSLMQGMASLTSHCVAQVVISMWWTLNCTLTDSSLGCVACTVCTKGHVFQLHRKGIMHPEVTSTLYGSLVRTKKPTWRMKQLSSSSRSYAAETTVRWLLTVQLVEVTVF